MTARQVGVVSTLVMIIYAAWTSPVAAYLDPGTGSMILQATIGAIAGGLVLLKVYWGKIKQILSTKRAAKPVEDGNLDKD